MEPRQFLELLRRWAWLLAAGAVLGLLAGWFGSRLQAPVYEAETRVLVARAPQDRPSDATYLTDQQLIQTYVQLVSTTPVLDEASQRAGVSIREEQVRVEALPNTQVIRISVEAGDSAEAAEVANILVQVLIDRNEALQAGRYASAEASIQTQIGQVESQIENLKLEVEQQSNLNLEEQLRQVEAQLQPLQEEVSRLQQEIAALEPAFTLERKTAIAEKESRLDEIRPLVSLYQQVYSNIVVLGKPVDSGEENFRLLQLQSTLTLYQQIYLNLLDSLEAVRLARLQNTPSVVQIQPAAPPEKPVRPRLVLNTILVGAIGLLLTAATMFLTAYLDDTLRTPSDVKRVLGLSVIGYIAEMQYSSKDTREIYITHEPRSPISEAFRSLRTNLEFAGLDKPLRVLLVTSPGVAEGKTTVSVNLAAIISQAGKQVILLDADLRRPQIHRLPGLHNQAGLSELFRDHASGQKISQAFKELPGLKVITSGSPPPNPAELLGSERMTEILAGLKSVADVVIIDSPPSLVTDAQLLASKVDGVVLVIQPGHTHAEAARLTMEMFAQVGARVVGVILNRVPRNSGYYYGRYRYFSSYQSVHESHQGGGTVRQNQPPETVAPPNQSMLGRFIKKAPAEGELPASREDQPSGNENAGA